jgi:hypothetical protein
MLQSRLGVPSVEIEVRALGVRPENQRCFRLKLFEEKCMKIPTQGSPYARASPAIPNGEGIDAGDPNGDGITNTDPSW